MQNTSIMIEREIATEVKALHAPSTLFLDILPPLIHLVITEIFQIIVGQGGNCPPPHTFWQNRRRRRWRSLAAFRHLRLCRSLIIAKEF